MIKSYEDSGGLVISGATTDGLDRFEQASHQLRCLIDDPVATIDQSCVGCGNCGEVADAAVLCPSFYRADVVHNPGPWEARLARLRDRIIGWLQARREANRLNFGGDA